MLKKLLQSVSVLLILTLVFSILACAPLSVSAAETDTPAEIGADHDPAEASAAAKDLFGELSSGRYTLTSRTYQLTADAALEGYLYVPSGVTAEIDLNGHIIDRGLTEASSTGFVIRNDGTLTIIDGPDNSGKITGGYAERGGAIYNNGTLTIYGGNFVKNKAGLEGGAVMNRSGANLTVYGGVFRNNSAETYGGGAFVNFGTMDISGGTIMNNTAKIDGGGIFNGGVLTVTCGTISGNYAETGQAGGILNSDSSSALNMSGSPVIKDNVNGNLILQANTVINVTAEFTDSADVDINAAGLSDGRAVTSGLNGGSASAFTFAYGATPATVNSDGEAVPDINAKTTVASWSALKTAVSSASDGDVIALENDIASSGDDDDMITVKDKNITIDLCGHSMNRKRSSSDTDGHAIWATGTSDLTVRDTYGGGVIKNGYATNGGALNINVDATLNLYNVTLTDNNATYGGAIFVRGTLNAFGSIIKNNKASDNGGAICVNTGSANMTACILNNNSAGDSGAVFVNSNADSFNATNSIFTNNKSTSYGGGAIASYIDVTLIGCTITGNTANTRGGGVWISKSLMLDNTVINNNKASAEGGAVYIKDGPLTVADCTFKNNTSNDGGAVFFESDATAFRAMNTDFFGNKSTENGGGAISSFVYLALTDCTVVGNTANTRGGGIWNSQSLTLENTVLDNNTAAVDGGAVYNKSGPLTMTDCTVRNNTAEEGGGVYVARSHTAILEAENTDFIGNESTVRGGGAVMAYADVKLSCCTLSDNKAKTSGGGIWGKSTISMMLCDITDNAAENNSGGGIYVTEALNLTSCDVSGNTCGEWGGGVYLADNSGATLNITDSTIENNTCSVNGGGVHVSGAAMMNVSGDIVIKNNYLDTNGSKSANNVRITDSAYIKKVGELTSDTEIYINPKIYNHALVMSITEDDMKYFIFDDPTTVARSGLQKTYINGKMYALAGYDAKKYKKTIGEPVKGGILDGATVRFRPHGSRTAVTVNKDGSGGSALHLYFLGHSSRFYLKKVSDNNSNYPGYTSERNIKDAYIIYNYHKEKDNQPTWTQMVAAEDSSNGASVHVEDSFSDSNENLNRYYWYVIPQDDGTYIIQNAKYLDHYWSLDNIGNQVDNNNELKAKSNAVKWDMEIISTTQYGSTGAYEGESHPYEIVKIFDSYKVTNCSGANSLNWMTNMPDEVKLSDLNIPGTHDAASLNVDDYDGAHCQQLYVDDMLNIGVRHLDLRIRVDNKTGFSDDFKMVHGKNDCYNRNSNLLYFGTLYKWCTEFLDENPGECLIFQIKEDVDDDGGGLMYKYFKRLASQPNSYIYCGAGMPTLGQLRGKIYIVSRLEQSDAQWGVENDPEGPSEALFSSDMLYSLDPYYEFSHPQASSQEVRNVLAKKWAYDASSYKEYSTVYAPFWDEEKIYHAEYCTTINDVELWTFDDWKNHVDDKEDEIESGLYSHESKTLDMIRDNAKAKGHDALCLYYTSDSATWWESGMQGKSNYDLAKEIQSWLFAESWYTDNIYTGCFCHNYSDGYSAYRSWASNYKANTGDWVYGDWDNEENTLDRTWTGPGDYVFCIDTGAAAYGDTLLVTKENPIDNYPEGAFVRPVYAENYKYEPKKVFDHYELALLDDLNGKRFLKHSLSLNGDIGVNFYLYLTAEEKASSEIVFTWNGNSAQPKTLTVPFSEAKVTDYGYRFSCPISAAEMNDTLTAQLYIGGELVDTDTYSARQYADVILTDSKWIESYKAKVSEEKYDQLATLIKTMLNYGASAQTQFEHNTGNPANAGVDYPLEALTNSELNKISSTLPKKGSVDLSDYGLSYYGSSLLLKTTTTLRFYFEITDPEKYNANDIRLGDITEVKPYKDGSKYVYIEAVGIAANDLDQTYTLSVGETTIGNYSALSYVKDVLTDGETGEPLTNTVTALYRFHKAAKSFFSAPA